MSYTNFGSASFITTEFENYCDLKYNPWGKRRADLYQHNDLVEWNGLPVFIKDFDISETGNVVLKFSALGCCDIFINGMHPDFGEMKPGWSDYQKRTLYFTENITPFIKKGKNRILFVLSTGWYTGRIAGGRFGYNAPSLIASIECDEKQILYTDKSWKCKVCGQIRTADIWDGEYRNAKYDNYDVMSESNYDITEWDNANTFIYDGLVTEFIGTKVKKRTALSLKPDRIYISDGTVYNGTHYGKLNIINTNATLPVDLKLGMTATVDFAQETVGWVKIKFKAVEGTTVKIRYSEFLNDSGNKNRGNDGPEGSVYTINLRSALAKGYIVSGKEEITEYNPTFTFYGYRYVEIKADNDIEILDLTAEIVGNDNRETGKIETSDESVNKLISNTLWGQRSNYLSVPTDCPQRDERLGWTGDAQAFSITAGYNADVYGFFRKWMQDMRDSQSETGGYADVNPRVGCCSSEDACAWGDAGVIIPYNLYWLYGDKTMILEHFDSMCRYMDGLVEKYGLSGPIPRYGDWLAYDWCDNKFISSAYFVKDCDMMAYMSEVIGNKEKAVYFKELKVKAQGYFNDNFTKDGELIERTQCNKIISLAFDLIDNKDEVADELVQQIKENDDRLSCGFLGTYNICPALSEYGKNKTAYNLLLQRKEPSWLYSIDQGATTIWERWNSYTKDKGFGDVGMNSFNHYAYGSIVGWMYRYMAGIRPAEPGFKKIKLAPAVDLRNESELPENENIIKWVKASYDSASGLIVSEWNNENGLKYYCEVPENIECELILPVTGSKVIFDGEEKVISGDTFTVKFTGGKHTVIQ